MTINSSNKRKIILGAVSLLAIGLLWRIRRRGNARRALATTRSASTASLPVVITKDTQEGLGLFLGAVASYPPRLSAVPILGMPTEGNPIEGAYLVLDALTLVMDGTSITGRRGEVEEALFTALTAAEIKNENQPAAVEAMKNYALAACPFMKGDNVASTVKCEWLSGAKHCLRSPTPSTGSAATKGQRNDKSQQLQNDIPIEFSYGVYSESTHVYMCPIPEANAVLSLIIVHAEGSTQAADRTDITTALKKAFAISEEGFKQLVETGTKCSTGVSTVNNTRGTEDVGKVEHAIFQNTEMRIRAVLPSLQTTVEEVRIPSVSGTKELFLTVNGGTATTDNATYCRITHHPRLPKSWDDEAAITDPSEKIDEYRRTLMFHFLGIVSNSITLHNIDIGGRESLWFSEISGGTTCRTYVCPNFDISGKRKSKKKGPTQKELIVIRWEAPTAEWEQSLSALNAFLEYFQFE